MVGVSYFFFSNDIQFVVTVSGIVRAALVGMDTRKRWPSGAASYT
jgi:hypothetical protein